MLSNHLLLVVYFIRILDYGNDVRQKSSSSDFLIQVQNGSYKAMKTTHNINNTFDPGTANEHTMQ